MSIIRGDLGGAGPRRFCSLPCDGARPVRALARPKDGPPGGSLEVTSGNKTQEPAIQTEKRRVNRQLASEINVSHMVIQKESKVTGQIEIEPPTSSVDRTVPNAERQAKRRGCEPGRLGMNLSTSPKKELTSVSPTFSVSQERNTTPIKLTTPELHTSTDLAEDSVITEPDEELNPHPTVSN
ncbi:hypothetical protein NDU88_011122 [Pleurodeles waltl]|uniref:Uncharacterized protein n=1 Tax=Pleurodeles waltl TaxID=8319 RepID=A0AAV7PZV5_PLEWA|nr:hypothetical protein NDU88_011122 [Pleurodeles waltl]